MAAFHRAAEFEQKHIPPAERESATYGMGGPNMFKASASEETAAAISLLILDRLAALAEALGVLPLENPEQGRYGETMRMDAGALVGQIEHELRFAIDKPAIMGMFGLTIGGRIFDTKSPEDAYGAYRLRELGSRMSRSRVCEIGGGYGGLAMAAVRAGFRATTVVDLPSMNVIQGYFLIKALGGGAVRIFGEPRDPGLVEVLPYWMFRDGTVSFDLVFNRDSMAEIPLQQVYGYLAEIVKRRAVFCSINQEGMAEGGRPGLRQLNVHACCARRPKLRLLSRHLYWLRRGYTEEVYSADY